MKIRRVAKSALRYRFREILEQRTGISEVRSTIHERLNAAISDQIRAYTKWKGEGSELTAKARARLEPWEVEALTRPVVDAFRVEWQRTGEDLRWADHRLDRLAALVQPEPGEDWATYATIYGSSYHTQGFGADTYARGAATLRTIEIGAAGIESRVVEVKRPRPEHRSWSYVHTSDWRVEARVREPLDLEILRRRPGLSLRDFMKACWARGLNPRVFNPFLPHGLEERLGIDYRGQDVPPRGERPGP